MSWHRFLATSDDDFECSDCSVVVSEEAMKLYSTPCPAPACTDDSNEGGCVIVPGLHGPECSYCERRQHQLDDDELTGVPSDAEADALLALADAELGLSDTDLP